MREISARSTVVRSIKAMILYVGILNVLRHVSGKIASGVTVRGDSGVAGEGRVVRCTKVSFLG